MVLAIFSVKLEMDLHLLKRSNLQSFKVVLDKLLVTERVKKSVACYGTLATY